MADCCLREREVYIGIQQMEYGNLAAAHLTNMGAFAATGSPFSVAAGRLSYTYGLRGPAVRRCSNNTKRGHRCGERHDLDKWGRHNHVLSYLCIPLSSQTCISQILLVLAAFINKECC